MVFIKILKYTWCSLSDFLQFIPFIIVLYIMGGPNIFFIVLTTISVVSAALPGHKHWEALGIQTARVTEVKKLETTSGAVSKPPAPPVKKVDWGTLTLDELAELSVEELEAAEKNRADSLHKAPEKKLSDYTGIGTGKPTIRTGVPYEEFMDRSHARAEKLFSEGKVLSAVAAKDRKAGKKAALDMKKAACAFKDFLNYQLVKADSLAAGLYALDALYKTEAARAEKINISTGKTKKLPPFATLEKLMEWSVTYDWPSQLREMYPGYQHWPSPTPDVFSHISGAVPILGTPLVVEAPAQDPVPLPVIDFDIEPTIAARAFQKYLDMGAPSRSLEALYYHYCNHPMWLTIGERQVQQSISQNQLKKWSVKYQWRERVKLSTENGIVISYSDILKLSATRETAKAAQEAEEAAKARQAHHDKFRAMIEAISGPDTTEEAKVKATEQTKKAVAELAPKLASIREKEKQVAELEAKIRESRQRQAADEFLEAEANKLGLAKTPDNSWLTVEYVPVEDENGKTIYLQKHSYGPKPE